MDKQFQARWRQAEAELRDICESNSAQVQALAVRLPESELGRQQLHTANETQLQLEAQALRRSRDLEQQVARVAHEREVELQELQDQSATQPQLLKAQWKNQMSQQATYKAEIHALNMEIASMIEKSELQATLSAKMCSIDSPRLTVEAAPDNVLNTAGPCRSPPWILPAELMTPMRPTTGGVQTPTGTPVAYGPSPVTQRYDLDTPAQCVAPAQ